jgi:hypothetical protein
MIEVKGRRGKRLKHLVDDLTEPRRYFKLKAETLHRSVDNWHWEKIWTCPKTDYRMNECTVRSNICDVELIVDKSNTEYCILYLGVTAAFVCLKSRNFVSQWTGILKR